MNAQKRSNRRTVMPFMQPNSMLTAVGMLLLLSASAFGQTPQIFQEFTPSSFIVVAQGTAGIVFVGSANDEG
jgi:hypothetical protein